MAWLLRVVADAAHGAGWVRSLTPFGWLENVRPFAGSNLVALLPLVAWTGAFTTGAVVLASRRDLGAGVFADRGTARSRMGLLNGPGRFAVRSALPSLAVWVGGVAVASVALGLLAADVARFAAGSRQVQQYIARFGATGAFGPATFLGVVFGYVLLPVSLYGAAQVAAARRDEAEGRAELAWALAVDRRRWLLVRVAVGAAGVVVISAVAGLAAWLGTAVRGTPVDLGRTVGAGLNCVPAAVLFLAVAATTFAFVPRLTVAVGFGAILAAYLVELIGALLNVPAVIRDLSPFHHVALAPVAPINTRAAVVMVAVAVALVLASAWQLSRRDLAPF